MSTALIIPSAGLGTRLAPLTNTLAKGLIRVGGKPAMMHTIVPLRNVIEEVVVIASPANKAQIEGVLQQALGNHVNWIVAVQESPTGPVDAIRIGLDNASINKCQFAIVCMADTIYEKDAVHNIAPFRCNNTALIAKAPYPRDWCYFDEKWKQGFSDGHVFTGWVMGKINTMQHAAFDCAGVHSMAPFLNAMQAAPYGTYGWHDVGDLPALHGAHSALLNARPGHSFEGEKHTLIKQGVSADEARFYKHVVPLNEHLFPHVYGFTRDSVRMEYITSPSLTELYLYNPATPDFWAHVTDEILANLQSLWNSRPSTPDPMMAGARWQTMMLDKPEQRMQKIGYHSRLWPHMRALLEDIGEDTMKYQGTVHGDPCFSNIFYDVTSGQMKFIDPRGSFGDNTFTGDIRYDVAKILLSTSGRLCRITHGLPVFKYATDVDEVITNRIFAAGFSIADIQAIMASQLLSSAALHTSAERGLLLDQAERVMEKVLG